MAKRTEKAKPVTAKAKGNIRILDKTVVRSLGLLGLLSGGVPGAVDVKDGKIVRIRPLHYDWKFDEKDFNPWTLKRNGKTLKPTMKSLISPFCLAYKKRTYSPNRIKYPLKRVDWNPNGERNTQNRGKSKFKRISWDEAAELVASEIRRVHKEYGPLAVMLQGDGHGENKTINTPHGQPVLLLEKLGGFTQQVRNPDSWEGWYWGAKHVWGQGLVGMMFPQTNTTKDIVENSDMVLFWGCDPETTTWTVSQFASRLSYFLTEAGIKQVYICPDLNYGAAVHADKWIPILPNTDAALQLAIIYTWIKEDTYDKKYVETHAVGFDRFKAYVIGEEDGIPKTPEWASKKCGVPEWTIKALARDWAKKAVSIAHICGGSFIRGPYSHEPARLEVILLAMQGLGKPGVHQCQYTFQGMPRAEGVKPHFIYPSLGDRLTKPSMHCFARLGKQLLPKTLIHKAIPYNKLTFSGSGAIEAQPDDQFKKYEYPIPEKEGGTHIHMIWTDTPCRTTCWNGGNETIEAMRNPQIECIVAQHPWLENDCLFADIILPVNTTMEIEDIVMNFRQGMQFQSMLLQKKAIEPVGEAKTDFEVVCEIAKKMGKYQAVTEGKTTEELEKLIFETMEADRFISWEDFKKKEYVVYPVAKDWEADTPGLRKFYEDPEKNPLPTPSGKLEFYSASLAAHFPDDKERPPHPVWVEKSEMHNESLSGTRARAYPLLVVSNHGRWRVHSQCDDISWTREVMTCKVRGADGYMYEPVWMHPSDAEKRGIVTGDIVKLFNERGVVLGGALVMERVMPGVISIDHGARVDSIVPGKLDRGGAIDLISPEGLTSKNCHGEATSGFLVEVEKVNMAQMEEWRSKYPEAFARDYDPVTGQLFNGWVEG